MDASILSAVAATLAALIGAANLYITGRRERRKWAREATVDAFVRFTELSYQSANACKDFIRSVRLGVDPTQTAVLVERARTAYEDMRPLLTRLMILSKQNAGTAATKLWQKNRAYVELIEDAADNAVEITPDQDEARRMAIVDAREVFLGLAKQTLSI